MQQIIQINIAGRITPIEESAYKLLSDYIGSLQRQFSGNEGKEIIEDIENRISELFALKLEGTAVAIDSSDVQKVIETLGTAKDLGAASGATGNHSYQDYYEHKHYRRPAQLLRNPYDKMIGGVCGGLGQYFDVDPVIIRVIMAIMFFVFGVGLLAYLIVWAIVPAARSYEELYAMSGGESFRFQNITQNVGEDLQDLKKRGEQMSRELKEFFTKKK